MNGSAILNADMATLGRWLRAGLTWWIAELRALLPVRWRDRAGLVARWDGSDGFAFTRDGQPVDVGDNAVVVVPVHDVLVREIELPALGRADLERMVALDLDRLMPFPPASALAAIEVGARLPNGRVSVAVAALPRTRAQTALAAARAAAITPRRLAVAQPGGARFDFLPALLAENRTAQLSPLRLWWGLVAIGFAVNLTVLVIRDVQNLRATEMLVDAQADAAMTARRLRARVIGEDTRRRAWLAARNQPLAVLGAATRALPDAAWVQRLAWDGQVLRLIGYQAGSVDVVAALRRVPELAHVRPTSAELPAKLPSGQPFDVTADTARAAR